MKIKIIIEHSKFCQRFQDVTDHLVIQVIKPVFTRGFLLHYSDPPKYSQGLGGFRLRDPKFDVQIRYRDLPSLVDLLNDLQAHWVM